MAAYLFNVDQTDFREIVIWILLKISFGVEQI